jgi:hypothetical protein
LKSLNKNESVVNEGKYDGMLDVIEDLVSKASSFMDVGNQLKKHKVKYSFSTSMMPIYRLDKLPIVIVNKKYVDISFLNINNDDNIKIFYDNLN